MTCRHAVSSWRGIVTNRLLAWPPGVHASISTCDRPKCIESCVRWVEKVTNEPAKFWTYEMVRLQPLGTTLPPKCLECGGGVDRDGVTTSDCAAKGAPDECEECGACVCDGSC